MWLLMTYTALALIGNVIIYFVGLAIEQVWPAASLPLYLLLFFAVLWGAWIVAVKVTEPKRAAQA
jgi:hypothetical protein